jgi:hypothetical protein
MSGEARYTESDARVEGPYRYWLTRRWDVSMPQVMFGMLNPSTAGPEMDDHTIRKCKGFCERWGYGGFSVGNAYAYRATKPKDMHAAQASGIDIIGPDNLSTLREMASRAALIVVAWGASTPKDAALHLHRVTKLLAEYGDLYCLGRTKSGAPGHPLLVPYDQPLELYAGATIAAAVVGGEQRGE